MKRKMFRKLMAASLAAVMAVSMAGCGNGGGNSSGDSSSNEPSNSNGDSQQESPAESDNVSEPEGEGEVSKYPVLTDENGNPYDLGGMEITIWSWFGDEASDDDYGEAREEWREWIQDTYNFTMTQETLGSWADCPESFVNYVTTGGDDKNYIFVGHSGAEMIAAMDQGLMYDVSTLDCLDFSERKFQRSDQCDMFSKDGGIYAFLTGFPEPRNGLYFNKRLLEQTTGMTADELYDMQQSNSWTWDAFEDVMKKIMAGGDVDNDGVQDIYPFACNSGDFVTAAVYSNGGRFFDRVDGVFSCELENPKTMSGMQWASEMLRTYIYPQPEGTEWNYFMAAFTDEGKIVFLPGQAYQMGQDFKNMEDDFGFLMFPIGPDADGYMNPYSDNVWVLPACYSEDRAWNIMFAYNLWTDEIPGFEEYNPLLSGYYGSARDIRTVDETLDRMMKEGSMVKYDDFIADISLGDDLVWTEAFSSGDVAAAVEGCKTKWQTAVDEANKK